MDVKILAICDTEQKYAIKLMEAFCAKNQFGFQIHAFSKVEKLEESAAQNQIEVLLISGKLMSESIGRLNVGKIILLSDGEVYEEFSDYESIYKYQSAEHIMKEVLCYCAEYAKPVTGMYHRKSEFEVYGIYSPIGRCGKTALARNLAKTFGKRKKTLLLDLQSYSAQKDQLDNDQQWDLSDMIYFLRQGKKTFLYKLNSIVRSKNSYDYILPMKIPADLRSVTLAEWSGLLEKLSSDSDYRVVVIDFGNDICGLFQLLAQCTKVFVPTFQDMDSKAKIENFEWNLREEHFEKVIESMQKICLPSSPDGRNLELFMEEHVERLLMS